ncbi:hypothetical protein M569_08585 [Genlisea aurea]|uniref:Chromatin modification-related protein EAF7 n=1 Tax=Genlisea aurea TaxID=192259 RepID=S8DSN6_9LAMI|nr:hypothetical protein M569_08585 [Genlisea aurea]
MGQMASGKSKKQVKEEVKVEAQTVDEEEEEEEEREREQEQDGVSVHSPCKIKSSSLRKENSDVELELALLESLEIYPPAKLQGPHRHFVIYGLTEYMRRSFNRPFTGEEVLNLLGRFYNLEMVKADDEDSDFLNQEEDFCLPESYFSGEDS